LGKRWGKERPRREVVGKGKGNGEGRDEAGKGVDVKTGKRKVVYWQV